MAAQDEDTKTSQRLSTDGGYTWGPIVDITTQVGNIGVRQPRLRKFDNEDRIYLSGRRNTEFGVNTKNGLWYTDDNGTTWGSFTPDATEYADSGYADLIKRSNDVFYMVGYDGTSSLSDIVEYVIKGIA